MSAQDRLKVWEVRDLLIMKQPEHTIAETVWQASSKGGAGIKKRVMMEVRGFGSSLSPTESLEAEQLLNSQKMIQPLCL